MNSNDLLLLKGHEIDHLLREREHEILEAVQLAYQMHAVGNTTMSPDAFLRFPAMRKHFIAKPAYLGGTFNAAGIKWIGAFPSNLARNIERASATFILNSIETGQPTAIMESSIIGAKRTAASAALAARYLWTENSVKRVGLIGCGPINYETLRFLLAVYPMIETVYLYNRTLARAETFKNAVLHKMNANLNIQIKESSSAVLQACPIISLATTAKVPHITSFTDHVENAVLLHLSLYDLSSDIILKADNIADDIDYVCNNNTSVHLAEQQVGHNAFMRTTIGHIVNGDAAPRDTEKPFAVYNPVGLGILDIAVALLIQKLALEQKMGTVIEAFLPKPWLERG